MSTKLSTRFDGNPTGRKDLHGRDILYGDFVECHSSYCMGGKEIGYASGWEKEVRVVLYDEENECPTLWLKCMNGTTDPLDWENDKEVGYLVKIESPSTPDPRIEFLKEAGIYDETCEFEWLKTHNEQQEKHVSDDSTVGLTMEYLRGFEQHFNTAVPNELIKEKVTDLLTYGSTTVSPSEFVSTSIIKKPWPLVAQCCGGMRWVSAAYENKPGGADYCFDCKNVCQIDWMTREQFMKLYNSGKEISQEEFKSMWDPATGPKEGYL